MFNFNSTYIKMAYLKFPDTVKLYTCLFFNDYLCDLKTSTSNSNLTLSTEQHRYCTRNAYSEELHIPSFRTNIRKFCPRSLEDIIGMISLSPFALDQIKRKLCLRNLSFNTIFLSINLSRFCASLASHTLFCVCVYHYYIIYA